MAGYWHWLRCCCRAPGLIGSLSSLEDSSLEGFFRETVRVSSAGFRLEGRRIDGSFVLFIVKPFN